MRTVDEIERDIAELEVEIEYLIRLRQKMRVLLAATLCAGAFVGQIAYFVWVLS